MHVTGSQGGAEKGAGKLAALAERLGEKRDHGSQASPQVTGDSKTNRGSWVAG